MLPSLIILRERIKEDTMRMKSIDMQIECCRECPYFDLDNNEIEKQWGKGWCTYNDKEVIDETQFNEDCPFDDI